MATKANNFIVKVFYVQSAIRKWNWVRNDNCIIPRLYHSISENKGVDKQGAFISKDSNTQII